MKEEREGQWAEANKEEGQNGERDSVERTGEKRQDHHQEKWPMHKAKGMDTCQINSINPLRWHNVKQDFTGQLFKLDVG